MDLSGSDISLDERTVIPSTEEPQTLVVGASLQEELVRSNLSGSDIALDERTVIPSTEEVVGASLQEEPVGSPKSIKSDEIRKQIARIADFLVRLQVTRPQVIRVTQARHALWRFGQVFREGRSGPNRYHQSEVRSNIAQFWSHSWQGSALPKVLLLLAIYNGIPAVLVGSAAFVTTRICTEPELGPFPAKNPLAWSMLAGVTFSSLTFLLWQSRRRVFLDRICIHQTNERLKLEGTMNLAALLKHSRSLLVCWDPSYMLRMWCTVELAVFLKCHAQGLLIIRPVSWGGCAIAGFLSLATLLAGSDLLTLLLTEDFLGRGDLQWVALVTSFIYAAFGFLFMYFCSAAARAHFRAANAVQEQLRTFSFYNDTTCHCCSVNHVIEKTGQRIPCDREALSQCLGHWFGSVSAFDGVVQQEVSASFERGVIQCLLPYAWLVGAMCPMMWFGIHNGFFYYFDSAFSDAWLAFCNAVYCFGWWLGTIPVIVALWLRIPRRCQRRRSTRCQEVMLNIACSFVIGFMVLVVRGVEFVIVFSMPTYGIITCTLISLLAVALLLSNCGRMCHYTSVS
ncbi:unnamed protein product [Effrenium voratum]|uniref:Transmembrane protein n=1 Tax=Effrenium voratum TaxID=2562239 RepID=A0AA36NIN6_9DINO|nr:unnamed protein product [Effrenium voratum]CAJ1442795.1 unnamed protein product [Effrenium voratum]